MIQLRRVIGTKPVKLLDKFREIDEFAVLVHGDFNRNNLMFKHDEGGRVIDMKTLDFQQVRYGSPCLDLAFFMYLNIQPNDRTQIWSKLLEMYHEKLLSNTSKILNVSPFDSIFDPFRFDKFMNHCQRFYLYGAIISETEKIAQLFHENMFDEKYRKFALMVGGELANETIVETMKHASKMGYLNFLYEME
uniref:CSON002738 protein n=1 Tax=Culicoides sonorensis TaxID=179676 RepID=A0A336MQW0_CULSO